MKKMNCFDVHDENVPAVVYELMFAVVNITGNDQWYKINPSELVIEYEDHYERMWNDRRERGPQNCYNNTADMEKLHKNWPTLKDAVSKFHDWLKSHGVNPEEDIMIKVWW